MKKLKKQSNLKVLATTSALIGVCYIGTGLNTKIASASPNKVPTVNASTQTTNSSFDSKTLNTLKKPFTATSRFFGRTFNSLKNCFGFKSSSSKNESFEMKQNDSSIVYADLNFEDNSNNNVRPRTEPETIYAQIKQNPTSNKKITVKADVHNTSSSNVTTSTQNPSLSKTGIDNKGFDNESSPNKSSDQRYLVLVEGSPSSTKPNKLFYKSEFKTDEYGYSGSDPIYQSISEVMSTKSSTNSSRGVNKPPIPTPRTKLSTKKVKFSPIVDRVTIREEGNHEVMYSIVTKLKDKS